jgi:AcrR family transcriptional regulator
MRLKRCFTFSPEEFVDTNNERTERYVIPLKIKERLYPVVFDFFSKYDFHNVNIRQISRASGVSTGTIYKYFPSKEDLILDILEEKIDEIHELAALHLQGIESTREKFRKAFWVLMDYYDRNPGFATSFWVTVPTKTWMQRKSYARYDTYEMISMISEAGRKKKIIDPTLRNSQIMGIFFMHCYREVTMWYFRGMKGNLVDTIDRFFPIFWKTVSVPECRPE